MVTFGMKPGFPVGHFLEGVNHNENNKSIVFKQYYLFLYCSPGLQTRIQGVSKVSDLRYFPQSSSTANPAIQAKVNDIGPQMEVVNSFG